MDLLLGTGNTLLDYAVVVLLYGALFLVMRYAHPVVDLNFRVSYRALYFGWAIGTFVGNYLFYLVGIMSFLPWLNNALHTFVWIGFCLGFLYAGCYRRPVLEQCALFFIFSLIVKALEHDLLGTWELDHFFMIPGNWAYIVGWSVLDGLYPLISAAGLRFVSRYVRGIVYA